MEEGVRKAEKGKDACCTHEHLPHYMTRCYTDDEADEHASTNGHEGLMDSAYAFYLEVVRCPEGDDEEDADEEQRP